MSPRAAGLAAARPRARPAWRALLGASAWCGPTAIGWLARHHLSRAVKHCDPAQGDLRPRVSFRPEVGAEPYCRSSSPRRALGHRVVVPPWEGSVARKSFRSGCSSNSTRGEEEPQRPRRASSLFTSRTVGSFCFFETLRCGRRFARCLRLCRRRRWCCCDGRAFLLVLL